MNHANNLVQRPQVGGVYGSAAVSRVKSLVHKKTCYRATNSVLQVAADKLSSGDCPAAAGTGQSGSRLENPPETMRIWRSLVAEDGRVAAPSRRALASFILSRYEESIVVNRRPLKQVAWHNG